MEKERECKKCKKVFPIEDFYKNSKRGTRKHICKYCFRILTKKNRADHADRFRAYWRKASKNYYNKDPRALKLRRNYSITIDDYLQMVASQEGKCKICKKEVLLLVIDHDHETNEIRGLLCNKCNLGLGHFLDNVELLKEAIEYLIANKKIKLKYP